MPYRYPENNAPESRRTHRAARSQPRETGSRLVITFLAAMLAACSTTGTPISEPIGRGSVLRLQQPFADLANGSHVDFQHGRRIAPGNLDRWTTYCRLYVYDPTRGAEHRISLGPGEFKVIEVEMNYSSSDFPGMVGPGFGHMSWAVRTAPAYYLYKFGMRISSPDQPEARSLDCYKKWGTPRANQYPTLDEIRAALGDLIKVELFSIAAQ